MGRRLILVAVAVCVLALQAAVGALAAGFTKTDYTLPMDDGVAIAATLYEPDGPAPATGWPAIVMFHGLGDSRQDSNALAETYFASQGYAVFTFDARGHGQTGGEITVDGPRELADIKALFAWLTARPEIDVKHIGAWGISYGGGAVWRSTVEGVPWAAIETVETWTDLYSALFPQDLSKTGIVLGFIAEAMGHSPLLDSIRNDAVASTNLPALRALSADRSSISLLGKVKTPAFMLQGRRDFAFDIDQATAAYFRLKGPKRLYIGDHGHPPSTFPAADTDYAMTECRLWFDRFLKNEPNGIDQRPPVEVATDPWRGKTVSYAGLPPRKALVFPLPGRRTLEASGKDVRTVQLPNRPIEEFGAPVVGVTASTTTGWGHLVAVLEALTPDGKKILVSDGGAATPTLSRTPRRITIKLISDATLIPAGSRLRVTLSATSLAADPAYFVHLAGVAPGSRITLGKTTVTVPVLATPISR